MVSYFYIGLLVCLTSGLINKVDTAPVAGQSCCPSGWTKFGSRCFIYYNKGLSWIEAEIYCVSLGGHLASVHSSDEHNFLREMIYRASGHNHKTWIGAFDTIKESVWMWSDGSKFDFNKWGHTEPNDPKKERCVEMNFRDRFWNDKECNAARGYVCSKAI